MEAGGPARAGGGARRRPSPRQHLVADLVVAEEVVTTGSDEGAAVTARLLVLAAAAAVEVTLGEAPVRRERAQLPEQARAPRAVHRVLHRVAGGHAEVGVDAHAAAPRRALVQLLARVAQLGQ